MPYSYECEAASMDGFGYGLEANTKHKYNFVTGSSCSDSTDQVTEFAKACQEIINYSHLNKEILIWSKDMYKMDSLEVQDVQLEDIKPPQSKHKKRSNLHKKQHK